MLLDIIEFTARGQKRVDEDGYEHFVFNSYEEVKKELQGCTLFDVEPTNVEGINCINLAFINKEGRKLAFLVKIDVPYFHYGVKFLSYVCEHIKPLRTFKNEEIELSHIHTYTIEPKEKALERQELNKQSKTNYNTEMDDFLYPEPTFMKKAQKKFYGANAYICPSCGGLVTRISSNSKKYKCRGCGNYQVLRGFWCKKDE